MKKMHVRITQDGRTEIKVEGGHGDDCVTFTSAIEKVLGTVQHREFNADYERLDPVKEKLQERDYTL
jgi:hypothetical protein